MKYIIIFLLHSLSIYHVTFAQNKVVKWEPVTMVNDITFRNSKIWNHNAACAFLVKYKNDIFAITAKHILNLVYSDSLQTAHFQGRLKQWAMYPKDKKDQIVIIDRLLNEDIRDSIGLGYMDRNWDSYNDWLIFSIKQNNSNVLPLEIRKTELKKGEKVFIIGWTYLDWDGEQRTYEFEYLNSTGIHLFLKPIKAPQFYNGLSGSPIIDSNRRLVGIMTGGKKDPETNELLYYGGKVDYLEQFFKGLKP